MSPLPANIVSPAARVPWKLALALAFVLALLVLPAVAYPIFLMRVMCFALFASAFNLLIGQVGLLSFGHAAFFGGAAYVSAHALKVWGLPPELAILAAVAFAAVMGALVGILAIRRHGIYFAMVTLAIAQMFYFFCVQFPATGGENGIQAVPRGTLFGLFNLADMMTLYYVVMVIFLFGIFAIWRVINSPFGFILKAIRDNEPRAISLGYNAQRYKLGAFVISAALTGLAGAMQAIIFQLAALTDVNWHMSGEVILMTLLGGIGTIAGPILGAAIVVGLQNYLANYAIPIQVVTGVIFIFCVMLFRRGIVGEIEAWFRRRQRQQR